VTPRLEGGLSLSSAASLAYTPGNKMKRGFSREPSSHGRLPPRLAVLVKSDQELALCGGSTADDAAMVHEDDVDWFAGT
jgi:hypothetical protein